VTVLEVITKSADFLARRGVDQPRLQTELLLAHVLKLPRMKLYLNFERPLSAAELDLLRQLVQRRGERIPLQHLIGSTSFCGYEIKVNQNVLIPRPETELLAEAGWKFLNELESLAASRARSHPTALDFGTGSGCIAIALAAKCPTIRLVASDLSAAALEVAQENARQNGVADRIEFRPGDGFSAIHPGEQFDLIVSNPPYIPSREIDSLEPEVRDHDPRLALDGGADGLEFYRKLAAAAGSWLRPEGRIMMEFGAGQAGAVAELLTGRDWIIASVHADYAQRERFLIAAAANRVATNPLAARASAA